MYPGTYAVTTPDKVAVALVETGETLTYLELEQNSLRLARVLQESGLRPGAVVALLAENHIRTFEVYWAAMRSGLYITAINYNLKPDEIAYIVRDSGATAVVASDTMRDIAAEVLANIEKPLLALAFDGSISGYSSYEEELASSSIKPLADQPHGASMLYSSGTTGRPKGIRPNLPTVQVSEIADPLVWLIGEKFGVDSETVYLSPAPLYHAAPMRWSAGVQAYGGTVIILRKFDAELTLATIEKYRVTHGQFVPTMFVRMLKLPERIRHSYDVSSCKTAIHAAAPCPVEVKERMINWWGPVLVEYYGGTEANGLTLITSGEWADKRGSVGRSILGTLHICDDDTGRVLPAGDTGVVYWERDALPFVYHNDPEKTKAAQHHQHPTWTTLGDIGRVDEDGYLFLTDRKSFTIISGGVNIYPQEIENALALHPAIHDVAVIGVPDPEMGESVKAFVHAAPDVATGPELGQEIIAFARSKIAGFKVPRSVEFVDRLPRTETGKLAKGELKKRYATTA